MTSQISRYRTTAAGPQAIWDVLADFGALSQWADSVDHSSVLEHGHDGAPIGTARRVQIGRNTLVERITEFAPPTDLAYDITGLPAWLGRVGNRWKLTPTATGGTVVALTSTVDIGTRGIQHAIERVVCRVLAKQSDAMLAGLADRAENHHG
ncbi:SRPBCC family protein [soil metagenome]